MSTHDHTAIQDFYPDAFAVCYGCGRLNAHGLHVRTVLQGEDGLADFTPRPEHTGVSGFVYGGLLASLIDCHAIGTAAAIAERTAGRAVGDAPAPRFVTAALHVDYLRPTPHGPPLSLRAHVVEATERKAVVEVEVEAAGQITVTGRVVAVRIPSSMGA